MCGDVSTNDVVLVSFFIHEMHAVTTFEVERFINTFQNIGWNTA